MKRLVLVLLLALVAGPAAASTYTVDRTDDDASATGCDDATANDCSLRGAIIKANAHGGDTVVLHSGTYNLTIVGAAEDGSATGDLDIRSSMTIIGDGSGSTIIDAAGLNNHTDPADRAIHVDPSGLGTLTVAISGVTIQNATTTLIGFVGADGAGIRNGKAQLGPIDPIGSTLTLTDVTLKDNHSAAAGGGIANYGTLMIVDSLIDHNDAHSMGGGIFQSDAGSVEVTDSTVSNNTATGAGGGLWIGLFSIDPNAPSATVVGSTFNDNKGSDGGGLFQNRGKLTVIDSTISHNSTTGGGFSGGGIGSNGLVTLQNDTITLNSSANPGGGISGNVTASNTIIAGNTSGTSPDCAGTLTSEGYNLIGSTAGCTIAGDTSTNVLNVSANLDVLGDNGGKTLTHKPLDGSPAIDSGNPAAPGGGSGACEATDQRGIDRPVGGRCDIGAFEGGNPCPAEPLLSCRQPIDPGAATLNIKKKANPAKDTFTWMFRRGAATKAVDFGDPTTSSEYRLCVYDDSGAASQLQMVAVVPAGGTCGAGPCWKKTKHGFRYKDKDLANDGIQNLVLRGGHAGKPRITVKGKGAALPMPGMPLAAPVTVQLHRNDGGPCWEAVYSAPARNKARLFKGKSD